MRRQVDFSDVRWLPIMWTRFLFLLFVVVLVVSCPVALSSSSAQVPKEWKKIDLTSFSFYAPPDLRDQKVRGIDSSVWEFRNRTMTLRLDYGMYSDSLESYSNQADYQIEWVRIDEKPAKIVTLRLNAGVGRDKGRTYAAAVYFPGASGETKLSFLACCIDAATRDSAKKVFLSIRFK